MKTIVTHSGIFHADDVFAVATLLLMFPDSKIIRSRDQKIIDAGDIVLDVGGVYDEVHGRFDHHQTGGAGERENGIPYASFGLLWKLYGETLSKGKEESKVVEDKLVAPIDALDNAFPLSTPNVLNITKYSISDFFDSFILPGMETEDYDTAFIHVVDIAKAVLEREIIKAQVVVKSRALVEAAYDKSEDKRIVFLEQAIPWKDVLIRKPEPLYVIYKSNSGWSAQGVPVSKISFETRRPFPESWAGKTDGELAHITGVEDALFCHRGKYLSVAKSVDGAFALAHKALEA